MLSSSGLVGIVVPDISVEFPIVLTGELSSVKAVPFPDERDPIIKQLPAERLVGDCVDDVNRDVTENGRYGKASRGCCGWTGCEAYEGRCSVTWCGQVRGVGHS